MDMNFDHKTKKNYKENKERGKNAQLDEMEKIKPRQSAIDAFRRPAYYKKEH